MTDYSTMSSAELMKLIQASTFDDTVSIEEDELLLKAYTAAKKREGWTPDKKAFQDYIQNALAQASVYSPK